MKKLFTTLIITIITFTIVFASNKQELVASENEYLYTIEDAEFRAAWVSYYTGDIRYHNQEQYCEDIDEILDILEFYNMNAMIFHVRANHDAWYKSEINRTNAQLIGVNFDEFDPLEYVITEAHKRGIEFHAWMNPYRIGSTYKTTADLQEAFKENIENPAYNPDNVLMGSTLQILDPGIPENRDFIVATCMELVENYDVDAIHFDDYFYASGIDDTKTRNKYNTENLSTADFRRKQVDTFIYNLKCALDEFNTTNNRYVQLGISPTGVYQNASSSTEANTPLSEYQYNANGDLVYPQGATQGCQNHYESYLYCDTLKWVNNEWINYILPQTYWARNHSRAPFEKLINWWNMAVKNKDVNLYAGMGIYMWTSQTNEALEQVNITSKLENVLGTSIYSFGEIYDGYIGKNNPARGQMGVVKTYHWNNKVFAPVVAGFEHPELGSVENFVQYENTISFSTMDDAKFYVIYRGENEITFDQSEIVDIVGSDTDVVTWTDIETGDYVYNVRPLSYTNTLGKPVEIYEENITGNVSVELYSDSNLTNKYESSTKANVLLGNNVFVKITDSSVSNNLNDYTWNTDNADVVSISENGTITINSLGSANVVGILKSDESKIVKFAVNSCNEQLLNQTYNVTFYDEDGTLLKEETVSYSASATPPTNLVKESTVQFDFKFVGWDKDYTNVTSDMEIRAIYAASLKTFTVTFKNPDGTIIKTEEVFYGGAATEPENPTMEPTIEYTYYFEKWDIEFTHIISDLEVTAVYYSNENMYNIKFNSNGGSRVSSNFYYYYEDVYAPTVPTKEGFNFTGWYFDEALTLRCTFPFKLEKDTTLYAAWDEICEIETYNVTYYNEANEVIETLTIKENEKISNILSLTKDGYVFNGWLFNNELFDFDTLVTQDINLYPSFEKLLTVTYYDNFNNVCNIEEYISGSTILIDTLYLEEGYQFIGWLLDNNNVYNKEIVVTEDIVLNVILKKIHTVYFYDNNADLITSVEVLENDKLANIPTYELEGYNFIGWSYDRETVFDLDTPISETFDLYPLLEEIEEADDEPQEPTTPIEDKNCKCGKQSLVELICINFLLTTIVLVFKKKRF